MYTRKLNYHGRQQVLVHTTGAITSLHSPSTGSASVGSQQGDPCVDSTNSISQWLDTGTALVSLQQCHAAQRTTGLAIRTAPLPILSAITTLRRKRNIPTRFIAFRTFMLMDMIWFALCRKVLCTQNIHPVASTHLSCILESTWVNIDCGNSWTFFCHLYLNFSKSILFLSKSINQLKFYKVLMLV